MQKFLLIVCIALILLGLWLKHWGAAVTTDEQESGYQPPSSRGSTWSPEREFRQYLNKAHTKNGEIAKSAESEINAAIAQFEEEVKLAIPQAEANLCGFQNSVALVWAIVADKAKGGDRTTEHIRAALKEPMMEPIDRLLQRVEMILKQEIDQLTENSQEMVNQMSTRYKIGPDEVVKPMFDTSSINELRNNLVEIVASSTITIGIVAGIEALCLKSTITAIRSLAVKLFTKSAAKAGASAAGSGTPVVGAVIAVGGAVWTVVDIVNADKKMRVETQDVLRKSMDQVALDIQEKSVKIVRDCRDGANLNLNIVYREVLADYRRGNR